MKSHELRVGNWVNNNEEDYQITSATIVQLERGDSTAKPIMITEEWLLKFGFSSNGSAAYHNEFELEKCGYGWRYLSAPFDTVVYFVHQLQNLYFALTGIELEIKK